MFHHPVETHIEAAKQTLAQNLLVVRDAVEADDWHTAAAGLEAATRQAAQLHLLVAIEDGEVAITDR